MWVVQSGYAPVWTIAITMNVCELSALVVLIRFGCDAQIFNKLRRHLITFGQLLVLQPFCSELQVSYTLSLDDLINNNLIGDNTVDVMWWVWCFPGKWNISHRYASCAYRQLCTDWLNDMFSFGKRSPCLVTIIYYAPRHLHANANFVMFTSIVTL